MMVFDLRFADGSSETVRANCMEEVYEEYSVNEDGAELIDCECDGYDD